MRLQITGVLARSRAEDPIAGGSQKSGTGASAPIAVARIPDQHALDIVGADFGLGFGPGNCVDGG